MCLGQIGSLLPHVVVPSILAAFLIPEWHLSGAQAGLLAGSGAAGYMLTVPVLATLTDRIDARHKAILSPYVWGDGDPNGVNRRAAEDMKNAAGRRE